MMRRTMADYDWSIEPEYFPCGCMKYTHKESCPRSPRHLDWLRGAEFGKNWKGCSGCGAVIFDVLKHQNACEEMRRVADSRRSA
jgi:hypothetical protein